VVDNRSERSTGERKACTHNISKLKSLHPPSLPPFLLPSSSPSLVSTVHELQKPMDMSFRERQTASLNGTFQVISWQDGGGKRGGGFFFGRLFKDFEHPIYGGWREGGREGRREGGREGRDGLAVD